MSDIADLEARYQGFIKSLPDWLPDGIETVDLEVLQRLNLLNAEEHGADVMTQLTKYFHIVEAPDKITLYNEKFVSWIIPQLVDHKPITFTLIAIRNGEDLEPELGFMTAGVYNSSRFVLRILERTLMDIQENQDMLEKLLLED